VFGLFNINKPQGKTSRDVVDRVQRLVRPAKAGHAGTLDPLATGVLVVCVGPATRLIEYVQQLPKRYLGTFLLGRSSPTEDIEGEITLHHEDPRPTVADVQGCLSQFLGTVMQRPPAYSALKIKGERAYNLARQGKEVELQPRPIEVFSIELVKYDYPEMTLDIRCGAGTYVRSLGRDIAQAVGTSAVMSALERTEIGPFHVTEATAMERLHPDSIAAELLLPQQALVQLPELQLAPDNWEELRHGRPIETSETATLATVGEKGEVAAVDASGTLVAILRKEGTQWWPARVFGR